MIYQNIPPCFKPKFNVVSCYVEFKGKILLLFRNSNKSEGNKWGVPAGKINSGENEEEAIVRELKEETGLEILPEKLHYFNKVYVRYPDYDFVYHIFYFHLDSKLPIKINLREHQGHTWVTPQDALAMKLVPDLDSCIRMYYGV